jgi:hypothetical protein
MNISMYWSDVQLTAYLHHLPLLGQICCVWKRSAFLYEEMMGLMTLPCAVLYIKKENRIINDAGWQYVWPDIFAAVLMKTAVFWDMTNCRQVDSYQCFEANYCLQLQGTTRRVEFLYSPWTTTPPPTPRVASSSKALVHITQTTWCHIPDHKSFQHLGNC